MIFLIPNLQVELIKLLLTDHTQLFCVGDDWQSIYGFRGSNVSYIVEFEKRSAAVISLGKQTTIRVSEVNAASFAGKA